MVQDMVYISICDIHYKINVNGECSTEFRSSRGVRQGDPLSPLLFIMAQQIFAFDLKRKVQLGEIKPYNLGRNTPAVSHLFFADDMLLFVNGRVRSLRNLRNLLQKYETSSGQQIHLTKSSLFVSKRIHGHKLEKVQQVMGVQLYPFLLLTLEHRCTWGDVRRSISIVLFSWLQIDLKDGRIILYLSQEKSSFSSQC